ncbi:MAG: UbiA prenyltransferase family protein [Dehalococcoidia bacterium]
MSSAASAAPSRSAVFHGLWMAARPYQWPKNVLVFAALAFSAGQVWTLSDSASWWPLLRAAAGLFAAWCLVASATYLVNDVCDREADRHHPRKQRRPIASGAVNVQQALILAVALAVGGLALALILDLAAGAVLAAYFAVMVAYSYGLKSVAVVDVFVLSVGLVARAVSGGLVIGVTISPWLYVCTSFGALLVATSKRWAESRQLGEAAMLHRRALGQYSAEVLGQMVVISAAASLIAYAVYTIESEHVPANGAMALTVPFAGFGLFRYLLMLSGPRQADAPDRILFTDLPILVAMAGFAVTAVTVLLLT